MISRLFGRERHLSDAELSGYTDGSLDTRSTRRVEGHLAACGAACAAQLEEMRTTIAILQSVGSAAAPRSFAIDPATVADIPERSSPRAEWLRSPVFAPALAASVTAVFFGVVLVADLTGTISQSSRVVEQAAVATFGGDGGVESDQAVAAGATVVTPPVEVEVEAETVVEAAAPIAAPAAAEDAAPQMEAAVAEAEEIAPSTEAAEEELGVASRAADATPRPLPSPGPAPAEAVEAPILTQLAAVGVTDNDGRRLPVWQLELASGLAALVLAGAAVVLFRRRRRQ